MSKNFGMVKGFYDNKLWSIGMVWNAVGRWINADEFMKITEKEYEQKQ